MPPPVLADTDAAARSVRILLVDDHEIVRSGLRLLLERSLGHTVIDVNSADRALTATREHDPEVVLLDVRMPERDGLWALARLRECHPTARVLMLSTYYIDEDVDAALEGGARGYVLKEASAHQLSEAIRTALGDGIYLHPKVAERLLRRRTAGGITGPGNLSRRELDVLRGLCDGLANEEIATRLFVSEKTVKSHLTSIYGKLGVANRTQAVSKVLREDLLTHR